MKTTPSSPSKRLQLVLAILAALVASVPASANAAVRILVDPFTTGGQHRTVVEPDTYSAGSTIVAVAQVAVFFDGGANDIGFATSTNNGSSWTSGMLPGITPYTSVPGPYDRAGDPSVAFDARHNVWIAASVGLLNGPSSPTGAAVLASRSLNGGLAWTNPVKIAAASGTQDFEKPWVVCDDTPTSPFYGSCYAQWDDAGHGKLLKIAYSRDGGLTWTQATAPNVGVIGGQPLVQPSGKVIIPIDDATMTALLSLTSANGGVSWSQVITITSITAAGDPGNIRSSPLPSAEIDGAGKVYVAWEDCRFRSGCSQNDIVYVTSSDGVSWSSVKRIPIDPVTSSVGHLIPGLGVDKATSGNAAHLTVAYYYFPNVGCLEACQLDIGSISSTNGGSMWSAAVQLAGPMNLHWLPNTTQGWMVGDYISTSFAGGASHSALVIAKPPSSNGLLDVALYDPPTRFPPPPRLAR
jgi:hypothetical protein